MAYQRPYNEDALPAFPEREGGKTNASGPAPQPPRPDPRYQPKPTSPRPVGPPQQHYASKPSNPNSASHYGRAGTSPGSYGGQPPSLSPRPYEHEQRAPSPGYHQTSHHSPNDRYAMTSPPPFASGGAPPPLQANRPSPVSRPPPSPAPQAAEGSSLDQTLLPLFRAVDKTGTGQLSERELSAALVNGDWTAFDPQTVRMMIRMFDSDKSNTIGYKEFCGLWSFLASWRTLFDRFDTDRSGSIELQEFSAALDAFRYRLSQSFVALLYETYTIKRDDRVMSFDLFVQACISLKRMTDVFKKYDTDRDGYISLGFEDFLTEILRQLR